MTLPETNPPPLATPVIGYAGADAIQLDLRALARIRLGALFVIAGLAGSFVRRMVFPGQTYNIQVLIAAGFTLCFVTAACLLAANSGLHSDRPVFRRLLVAAAIALAAATAAYILATFLVFSGPTPDPSKLWILNVIAPFSTVAYATAICLCFVRLATLARQFHARAIAVQCTVAAVMFLSLQALYLSVGLLVRFAGANALQSLSLRLSEVRPVLSIWAIFFLAVLVPRLKPTPS